MRLAKKDQKNIVYLSTLVLIAAASNWALCPVLYLFALHFDGREDITVMMQGVSLGVLCCQLSTVAVGISLRNYSLGVTAPLACIMGEILIVVYFPVFQLFYSVPGTIAYSTTSLHLFFLACFFIAQVAFRLTSFSDGSCNRRQGRKIDARCRFSVSSLLILMITYAVSLSIDVQFRLFISSSLIKELGVLFTIALGSVALQIVSFQTTSSQRRRSTLIILSMIMTGIVAFGCDRLFG